MHLCLQLVGEDIVPVNAEKQTLLLYTVQQLLPRLFNGIGPRWARITSVRQSAAAKTANVTFTMSTSSVAEYFEQVGLSFGSFRLEMTAECAVDAQHSTAGLAQSLRSDFASGRRQAAGSVTIDGAS